MCANGLYQLYLRNPVVTLLINNKSSKDVWLYWDPVYTAAGIADMAYVPPKDTPHSRYVWPTLGYLIETNKRFVVFMDYPQYSPQYVRQNNIVRAGQVLYIHPEFDHVRTLSPRASIIIRH